MYLHAYWRVPEYFNKVTCSVTLPTPLQLDGEYKIAVLNSYLSPHYINVP